MTLAEAVEKLDLMVDTMLWYEWRKDKDNALKLIEAWKTIKEEARIKKMPRVVCEVTL